jgi:hypothetical protein
LKVEQARDITKKKRVADHEAQRAAESAQIKAYMRWAEQDAPKLARAVTQSIEGEIFLAAAQGLDFVKVVLVKDTKTQIIVNQLALEALAKRGFVVKELACGEGKITDRFDSVKRKKVRLKWPIEVALHQVTITWENPK